MATDCYEKLLADLRHGDSDFESKEREQVAAEQVAEHICRGLRELRKESRFSQQEVADRIGVNQSAVSRLENCKEYPSVKEMALFAGACRANVFVGFFPKDKPLDKEYFSKAIVDMMSTLFNLKKKKDAIPADMEESIINDSIRIIHSAFQIIEKSADQSHYFENNSR